MQSIESNTRYLVFGIWSDKLSFFISRAAVACIGGMYEKLGRMVGRSYEETINLLIKALKNAEVRLGFFTSSM